MPMIEKPYTGKYALTHLGFRPFFLLAGLFAVVLMGLWVVMYGFNWQMLAPNYASMTWHAHEMIFGYSVAMAAGFLLTAARNWTNLQTINGKPLLLLALLWVLARLLPLLAFIPLWLIALIDITFLIWLSIAIARPIIRVKQWQQMSLAGKIFLLVPANALFYYGLLTDWSVGVQVGLYSGFYIILALIFTMGRRVIPFFIERGVGCPFNAKNDIWIDRFSLILFLSFSIADVLGSGMGYNGAYYLTGILALIQIPLHAFRMGGWYHPNIWDKPLLWVLYMAYGWLVAGFLFKFMTVTAGVSPWIGVHAFAVGGIGMMTIGMMARVALGHTGRNVFEPPAILAPVFLLLFSSAFIRVFNVWLVPEFYAMWILSSQLLWITAFALFVWHYLPMLMKARIDQRYG